MTAHHDIVIRALRDKKAELLIEIELLDKAEERHIATTYPTSRYIPPMSPPPNVPVTPNYKTLGGIALSKANLAVTPTITMKQKVAQVIITGNRFLHISEIASKLKEWENSSNDIQFYKEKVRMSIAPLKEDGTIVPVQLDNQKRNTVWGSPAWLDGNKIKPEHQFNTFILNFKDED